MKIYFDRIRQHRPLIHCITNPVTVNDCANLLLAAGASPTMAHHPSEVEEITAGCHALVCNLGATGDYEAMVRAALEAHRKGHPIVVDPVGAGGSAFRREYFWWLAGRVQLSCIRGNAAEIAALSENHATVTGVDVGEYAHKNVYTDACLLAERTGAVVIASGVTDTITDGTEVYLVQNGDEWMSRITGTGCMSSALLGAYLAEVKREERTEKPAACAEAVAVMGICGELAAAECRQQGWGTMTFRDRMIDRMSLLEEADIRKYCRIEKSSLKK